MSVGTHSKEAFIDNVWDTVAKFRLPIPALAEISRLRSAALTRQLLRVPEWLNANSVEAFDPDDFADLDKVAQVALKRAVKQLRSLAAEVDPEEVVSPEFFHTSVVALENLVSALRQGILPAWTEAVEDLINQTQIWAEKRGWFCNKGLYKFNDLVLGEHQLLRLSIVVQGGMLLLTPESRFAYNSLGVARLVQMDSDNFTAIVHSDEGWYAAFDPEERATKRTRKRWNEKSFLAAVDWLLQLT